MVFRTSESDPRLLVAGHASFDPRDVPPVRLPAVYGSSMASSWCSCGSKLCRWPPLSTGTTGDNDPNLAHGWSASNGPKGSLPYTATSTWDCAREGSSHWVDRQGFPVKSFTSGGRLKANHLNFWGWEKNTGVSKLPESTPNHKRMATAAHIFGFPVRIAQIASIVTPSEFSCGSTLGSTNGEWTNCGTMLHVQLMSKGVWWRLLQITKRVDRFLPDFAPQFFTKLISSMGRTQIFGCSLR